MILNKLKSLVRAIESRVLEHISTNQNKESLLQSYALLSATNEKSGIKKTTREHALTVSLTTYGKRIHTVYLTIESMFVQSLKADRVVLWLAEDEFSYDQLPETLKNQEKRGLTIKFCKDLRSYKKLIPSLKTYPNDLIVTIDDDIIYPIDHLDRLYQSYLNEPEIIHCHRAHKMRFDKKGKLLPYNKWINDYKSDEASVDIFPTGCGGTLYFPGCFHPDILNEEKFTALCPLADDVWFKFMSYKADVKCKVIKYSKKWSEYVVIPESSETTLWDVNRFENDRQIKAFLNAYPDIKLSN